MTFLGRLFAAALLLAAIPFHALVPAVKITGLFSPYVYDLLSGADPLVTAYVDAGWLASLLLLASSIALFAAIIGVLKGERWAALLVVLAAISDAVSLYAANTMGYTRLDFSALQIVGLGAAMVFIWVVVRMVTKPA